MSLYDFTLWLTRAFIFLTAATAILNYASYRDRIRADIALVFGSLGATILIGTLRSLFPALPTWLGIVSVLLLVALPYLTLRLVQHFRSVPSAIRRIALIGCLLSALILVISPQPFPLPLILPVVGYFVVVAGYSAVAFVRGALAVSGVTRWRLLLIAIGTGLLATNIFIAGINILAPTASVFTQPISSVAAVLAVVAYYLGASPPRWLRRSWQFAEIHRFLQESSTTQPGKEIGAEILHRLARFATRAVGGTRSLVALWNASDDELVFSEEDSQLPGVQALLRKPAATAGIWTAGLPGVVQVRSEASPQEMQLGETFDADVFLVVPLQRGNRRLGLLMVFQRYGSLFPGDDLDMLRLLAQQSATDMEYAKLLNEQQSLMNRLEEANRELEAFGYSVSHDMRAPLRAVDAFAKILDEEDGARLSPGGREALDFIIDNSRQMAQLIEDILMLSRISRQEVVRRPIEMKELANSVLVDLLKLEPERVVHMTIEDIPPAEVHEGLMRQVLTNLLSNALKFSRSRDITEIKVGFQVIDGEPVYYVRDNGSGFDIQYAGKLFGVFQRLHLAEEIEGTGIGLAIVQRIIRKHGGRVWAEGEVGKGATFYFTIGDAEAQG